MSLVIISMASEFIQSIANNMPLPLTFSIELNLWSLLTGVPIAVIEMQF